MKETEIVMAQQTPSFFGPQLILLIGFVAILCILFPLKSLLLMNELACKIL